MEVEQSGRFVSRESGAPCSPFGSCGPASARQTDTLASLLFGARLPLGSIAIAPKVGIGLSLGTPHQGALAIDMQRLALTAGSGGFLDRRCDPPPGSERVPGPQLFWRRRRRWRGLREVRG